MNHKEQNSAPEDSLVELDMDSGSSVEDFIRELEAKEKDLHITADLTIEIEESDFDEPPIPDFVKADLAAPRPKDTAVPVVATQSIGAKTRIYELEQEIEMLNERITGLRADRHEIQEKSDRRLKDFENYKYRMDRERRGSFIDQISNLALQMLPVLDNLDRALDSADRIEAEKGAEFQQLYDGIVLVSQQLKEIFSGMGVAPIATVGETFDPNFHEAVSVERRDDMPANTVTEEMLRGYRIGNRVIRHSMVKVTTAPPAAKAASPVDLDPKAPAVIEPEIESSLPDLPEAPSPEAE